MPEKSLIPEDSFRIDKYLINDIHGFNVQISLRGETDSPDSDEKLVRNVVYSVADDYEHNLMGFGHLDPARFAAKWDYDPSYLRRRVENPYQLSSMPPEAVAAYRSRVAAGERGDGPDGRVWDTRLENALYILAHRTIDFDQYGEFVEGRGDDAGEDVLVKAHSSFTLFTSIAAVERGRGKTVYTYTLNENFEKNLTRYYIRGDRGSLIRLRGCGLDSLYLYLSNLRTNLGLKGLSATTPGELPDFEYLCRMAEVPARTKAGAEVPARERKRLLSNALSRVAEETDLRFTVRWNGGRGRKVEYTPVIDFGTTHLLLQQRNRGLGRIVANAEQEAIQRQVIAKNLLDMYRKTHNAGLYLPADEEAFNAWALDNGADRKEKETALRMACIWIFRRIPDNEDRIMKTFFDAVASSGAKTLAGVLAEFRMP